MDGRATVRILSVNLAVPEVSNAKDVGMTGINKRPVDYPVLVRPPGPKTTGLHSGLVGDQIFDIKHHGGDDQAVYAYAREDLDWWETEVGQQIPGGKFGENLTTAGVDVNGALVGEQWRIGSQLILQATSPRIPCATFQAKMAVPQWVKRFTAGARPGAYLRVVQAGEVRADDPVEIVHRPDHHMTIEKFFRAWTLEPSLLDELAAVPELDEETRAYALKRAAARREP
ncbi:MOSC domain-containing protein [Catelliglobosispora koreensis]|uniref:MOSC domain-containing protein n=1 Tax=Catelliglobosispora koreensis TaxID=129052 RepID=UPI00058F7D0F|nr:MOSC domain-containing protein [Catelliglobosispora koreensis]